MERSKMREWISTLMVSCALGLGACEHSGPAPDPGGHDHHAHHHVASAGPSNAKKADEPVGPRLETGSFLLAVAPAQSKYSIGKAGEIDIALEGRGEWHVNQEYPIRIELKAGPGVTLKKRELIKEDAKVLSEQRASFVAAVEPVVAGQHEVACDVSFAMCTEENCILENRTVAMRLEVQ
jgi:hypothetical protein